MIYIVTYIEVQPDSTSRGLEWIEQYVKLSGDEEGNSGAELLQEIHRANRFVVVEVWKDESSFQAHENAPHTEQFRSSIEDIHNSPSDQRVHHAFAVQQNLRAAEPGGLFAVTHVDVPPPRREETEILLKNLAEQSRQDEGNVRYEIFQQSTRPNHFTVVAAWAAENAFISYGMKTHTREFREALGPMLGAPYDERLYRYPSGS